MHAFVTRNLTSLITYGVITGMFMSKMLIEKNLDLNLFIS